MAKCYYNGVLLPKIPADVLAEYPYAWIRNNTRTGYYDLLLSQEPWYLQDETTLAKSVKATKWYRISIASADTVEAWTFNSDYDSLTWGNESDRLIMWSNHDIPNGSATSATIYFYATDPVPENEAKPKELKYEIYHDFYPSSGNINYLPDTKYVNYVVPVVKYSTYTVTMVEVGTRLRSVFTTVDPATITANITGCTDIVMNPTFAAGYTFTYFAQEDGWMVVYVSNASECPKISIVTNGAGGDGAPSYDRKYLVRSGSTLYTIVDGALFALETSDVTAELFRNSGIEEPPTSELLVTLTDPEILYWVDTIEHPIDAVKVTQTAIPFPQTLESLDYFMSDETVLGIEKAVAVATESVQFAVSFDSGATWKTFIDGAWAELSENSSGMSATTLNSIPTENWNVMVADGKFRFRISLMDETSEFTSLIVDYLNEAEVPAESNEGDE